jgi:predicted GNAT superfamily acetyltransferase
MNEGKRDSQEQRFMKAGSASEPTIIRALTATDEMAAVVELQREIWGYGDTGADHPYPARALFAFSESGGLVSGAFTEEGLVGFALAWLGRLESSGRAYLHSQLVGVLPRHRHLGIAFQLKLHQRSYALEQGLTLVRWTFDPLLSTNARLNLRKLGAVAQLYRRDYYGAIRSHFGAGIETDRLWVDWYVKSPRVESRLSGNRMPEYSNVPRVTRCEDVYVGTDRFRAPVHFSAPQPESAVLVEIPTNFDSLLLKAPELALRWRDFLREVITAYLAKGYIVDDLWLTGSSGNEIAYYHLSRKDLKRLVENP